MTEQTENTDTDKDDSVSMKVVAKWILLTIAILATVYFVIYFGHGGLTQERLAQFGDFVGGTLNPILGFLTVGLLVWSIQIQMKELKATREEITATKRETKLSRKAMEEQVNHFSQEAELSEIMRLLDDVINRYNKLLTKPAPKRSSLISIFNISPMSAPQKITIDDVIHCSFNGNILDEEQLNKLKNYIKKHPLEFKTVQTLIELWHNLYLRYCEINESKSFQMTKGTEWYMEALYVSQVIKDKSLQRRVDGFKL